LRDQNVTEKMPRMIVFRKLIILETPFMYSCRSVMG